MIDCAVWLYLRRLNNARGVFVSIIEESAERHLQLFICDIDVTLLGAINVALTLGRSTESNRRRN